MRYADIINRLAERREKLGMSDTYIAQQAGISQPTVNRILSGRHKTARLDHLLAMASVLGLELITGETDSPGHMRRIQAEKKAEKLTGMVQATASLEAQGMNRKVLESMKEELAVKLLAGPSSILWSE